MEINKKSEFTGEEDESIEKLSYITTQFENFVNRFTTSENNLRMRGPDNHRSSGGKSWQFVAEKTNKSSVTVMVIYIESQDIFRGFCSSLRSFYRDDGLGFQLNDLNDVIHGMETYFKNL